MDARAEYAAKLRQLVDGTLRARPDDPDLRQYERRLVELLPSVPRCRAPHPLTIDDVAPISCQLYERHAPSVWHWHWTSGVDVTWPTAAADE